MQQHTTNNIQPVANQPIKEELEETESKTTNLDTITDDKGF